VSFLIYMENWVGIEAVDHYLDVADDEADA